MGKLRYVAGDIRPILVPTNASHPINEGDLVFVHPATGQAWPAADMANQGTKALNQDAFQQYFAGVAMSKVGLQTGETSFRLVTDPGYVVVATAGDFRFPCASNAYKDGDLIGVYADGNGCNSQKVDTAASASLSIGRAVVGPGQIAASIAAGSVSAVTQIVVRIQNTIMDAGVQSQVTGSGSGQ